ncbi:aldo/keto reductase [Paenibacillus sp. 1P07SE]|uniref:aldo/keto reductase n=1 Tax=Paenibacillus sp. 1P07SE TaxID=3132209 RepID=UPI0039A75E41
MKLEKRKFGRTDMEVTALGFGAAEIGITDLPEQEAIRLLQEVLDTGINVVDTASTYNNSEELIGKAISDRRDSYYLFTKCGEAQSVGLDYPDWDPRAVRPSIERSLKRMKTDYVDLVQIHSCSEAILRQGGLIEELQKARAAGLTRYIGYSGDSTDALYAVETGVFDTLQTSINIADQEALDLFLSEARQRELGIIAKRPVANVVWKRPQDAVNRPDEYEKRLDKLDFGFIGEDPKAAIGTALRFTLAHADIAIVGTTNMEHLRDNLQDAGKGPLEREQLERIRARWQERREPAWAGKT